MGNDVRSPGLLGRVLSRFVGPIDVRPLALMRITFGAVLLVSVLDVVPVLVPLLSDDGILTRSALFAGVARVNRFSVWDVAGPTWVSALLLGVTAVAALAFTAGYRTRASTIACYVLVTGLHERNPAVFDGADNVVRVLLFWLIFTPAGARYSIDAVLRAQRGEPRIDSAPGLGVRLARAQIAWIYFATFLGKMGGAVWRNGTALHYALSLRHSFTRPLGAALADVAPVVRAGTYGTLALEASFLFLVLSPVLRRKTVAVALVVGAGLHAGIAITMSVGNFSYLMPACYPIFFEPAWADRVARIAEERLGLRRATGDVRAAFAPNRQTSPLSSRASWLTASNAAVRALGAGRAGLVALFVAALWYSLPGHLGRYVRPEPGPIRQAVEMIELWQSWDMFAPDPAPADFYLRGVGKLKDGTVVDVAHGLSGGPLPPPMPGFFFSRWTKLIANLAYGKPNQLLSFGSFVCNRWNDGTRKSPLAAFKIYREERVTAKLGAPPNPWEEKLIWDHRCF